jgi:hypothetical protein
VSEVTNTDIYSVLLDIKEDIGGLKASSDLQLKGLTAHGERIATLEESSAKQKGAAKVWGLVGTAVGGLAAAVAGAVFSKH